MIRSKKNFLQKKTMSSALVVRGDRSIMSGHQIKQKRPDLPSFTKLEKNAVKNIFKAEAKSKKSLLPSDLNTDDLETKLLSTKKMINIGKGKKEAAKQYLPKSENKELFYQVNENGKDIKLTFYKNIFSYE